MKTVNNVKVTILLVGRLSRIWFRYFSSNEVLAGLAVLIVKQLSIVL